MRETVSRRAIRVETERMSEQPPPGQQRSVADLTRDLSTQTSELVRREVALAIAEIKEKGTHAGVGVGLFGGAGVVGFYAVGALVATAILGLAEIVDGWLAALIVSVVLIALAAGSALAGKREVSRATPPVPEQAKASVQADVEAVKQGVSR